MRGMWKKALIGAGVLIAVLAGLREVTRCRTPFTPFTVEALSRETRIAAGSPLPELILAMSGIQAATLYQADSAMVWPEVDAAGVVRPTNVHVGLYSTGGYAPVEYLVACQLSGTIVTQLTATPWDAGTRNGVYTVAPVATRISGTPFVAVAWLRSLGHLDSEHVRLLRIGLDPLVLSEVWRSDVASSSGGGVFIEEVLRYSFAALSLKCPPVIVVKKGCTGDDCGYRSRTERWEWREGSGRFILKSSDETPR